MKLFRTRLVSVFRAAVLWLSLNLVHRAAATVSGCVGGGAADVVFLLDSSYSVWRPDFRRQLTFVQEVIEMLPIGLNNTRVAIVTYADYPQLQFHLHQYSTKPDLRAAVEEIRQRGGFQTITGDAIQFVRRNVFEVGSRSRPLGLNVARVAVVVTDGRSDNRTATVIEAELAKQEGIRMFLVGVGKDVDLEELKDIASLPSDYYTFQIDSFAGLAGIRDLVATRSCEVAESVWSTKVFATSTTGARSVSTRAVSVKTTLRQLVSTGVDSTSTTVTVASLPSTAPSLKSTFSRPSFIRAGSSRAAFTTAVSSAAVTSQVSSTTTYKATSVSTWKLLSETAVLQPENVSLPPTTGITSAEELSKVENLQPPSKELPMAIGLSDGVVQTESNKTAIPKQSPTVFPTRKSEVTDKANASDFPPSKDSTDNPHKITTGMETSCGFGLLDKIINGKSSSEAPKRDRETEHEKDGNEEQQRQTNNGINSGATVQENDDKLSNYRSRTATSIPVILVQLTDDVNGAGTKTILEATSTISSRRVTVTDGTTTTKSSLTDGPQERKEVITSGYGNRGSDETSVLATDKETKSDQVDSDGGGKEEDNGRLDYESGYQANDYWRLTDGGMLVRYRMIRPGEYERETKAAYRTPRLEPNPRRLVVSRSEASQSSALDDRQGQDKSHLNQESTEEESRGNLSRAAHNGHPTYRPRLITRTKARRIGYPRGSDLRGTIRYRNNEAVERRNRERPYTHKPQMTTDGYWRLSDSGKLVWMPNRPSNRTLHSQSRVSRAKQSHATGNPQFSHVQTRNTWINPGSSHTHSHLEVSGADHLASNSGAHPRLTTHNPMIQKTSFATEVTDVAELFSKEMTDSTKSPRPSVAEIESHNPKDGFWKHDRYGRNSVWVSYTRSDDALSADSTTDAQPTTHASVDPTSGTKGPALVKSDGHSYGYWKRERGRPVWYEYQSPGIYRKVIDTDPLAVPNRIRIELPPWMVLGCTDCNLTGSPVWDGPVKVNKSSSSEEVVVYRASDRLEKLMLNRTRPITLDENRNPDLWQALENLKQRLNEGLNENSNSSQFRPSANSRHEEISTLLERTENKMSVVHRYNRTFLSSSDHGPDTISLQFPPLHSVVRGTNATGNSKSNWTYENIERMWIRGNEMHRERERSQRTNITTGVQQGLKEKHRTSSTSTTVTPGQDGALWSATATNSVSSSPPTRRHLESRNPNRAVGTDSVHKKGREIRKNPPGTKSKRKHAKGCVARRLLDVVFVVDPRARKRPYTRHLWQLAYEVVSRVRMDDDRIKVRFYPELEVVKASTNGSTAEYGNVQTVIQKVAKKSVPELLRAASLLLAKSDKGVRRIGIYLTDGRSGATPRELESAAEEVKGEAAVEMFAVGVGQETDPAELETIASKRKGKHLFRLTKLLKPEIDGVALNLTRALCGGR